MLDLVGLLSAAVIPVCSPNREEEIEEEEKGRSEEEELEGEEEDTVWGVSFFSPTR